MKKLKSWQIALLACVAGICNLFVIVMFIGLVGAAINGSDSSSVVEAVVEISDSSSSVTSAVVSTTTSVNPSSVTTPSFIPSETLQPSIAPSTEVHAASSSVPEQPTPSVEAAHETIHFVLNTDTHVFHLRETCNAALKIKDANRGASDCSVDEMKAQGYTACGICAKAYK